MDVCIVVTEQREAANKALDAFYDGNPVTCPKCGRPGVVTNVSISGKPGGCTVTTQYVHP